MNDLPAEIEAEDGDLIEESDPLTPREADFVERYSNPESESYGQATKSARLAGYGGQAHAAAWRLRRRARVMAKIEERQRATMATIGKIFSDLENQRLLALAKNPPDIQAANRSSELQGRHLAMFTDRVVVDEMVVHEYDALLEVEAHRLARLLLEDAGDRGLGAAPALEGKVGPAALGALPELKPAPERNE